MVRNITVVFDDGTSHVYQNAPDDLTPDAVQSRAQKDFGKSVVSLDGGKKPAAATKPAFAGSKANLIPGAESDVLPTSRKEMGLMERAKDIGKGIVEIPGAMIGGALQPVAAGYESLMTGQDVKQSGYQMKPVESQFAQDVLGGLGGALETAKVPAMTPGMLAAPTNNLIRPAIQQAAAPVAREAQLVGGVVKNTIDQRATQNALAKATQSVERAPQIEAAQEAHRLGIALPPAESNPTLRNRITEKVVGAANIEKQVAEVNKHAPTRIAKNELDIPETATLSPKTFAEARTAASKPYETIKAIPSIAADESTIGALNDLRQSEALIGGKATKGKIDSLIDDAVGQVQQGLSGDNLLKNISNLRKDARTIYKKADLSPEERVVADANIGIANALESMIEKNIAGDATLLEQFRDARTRMAKSYAYENATDMNTGMVDASKLAKLTAKDNALTGDIAALGKIAGNFPEAFTVRTRSDLARAGTYLARTSIPGSVGLLVGGLPGGVAGAALGKIVESVGAKRVVKPGYQAKRAIPKDYRNNLAPIEKLNKLAK